MATEEEMKAADKFLEARRKFKSKLRLDGKIVSVDEIDYVDYTEACEEFEQAVKKE